MTDSRIFSGTGVALATPLHLDLSIDFPSLEKLVEYCLNGQVDYLVVLGTTGESPVFSWEEKMEILDFVIRKNQKRVPIVFGLGGNNTSELVDKCRQLPVNDLDAILSVNPYYSRPSQKGIIRHYEILADASPLPVILYNVPSRTASDMSADTTLKLSEHSNIIGMKEASGNLEQCQLIIENKADDFLLISGDDRLTNEMIRKGADGVISVVANIIPQSFTEMVNKALEGNFGESDLLDDLLKKSYSLSSQEGNPTSLKAGLEALGICGRNVRPPLFEGSDELKAEWSSYLAELKQKKGVV